MNDLFADMVRNNDPDTSHQAAAAVTPKLSRLKREILQYFEDAHSLGRDGVTDYELVRDFPMYAESTARKRRSELTLKHKLIKDSGIRRWVAGSGRIVWKLVSYRPKVETPF